jgi:hypothetical protein
MDKRFLYIPMRSAESDNPDARWISQALFGQLINCRRKPRSSRRGFCAGWHSMPVFPILDLQDDHSGGRQRLSRKASSEGTIDKEFVIVVKTVRLKHHWISTPRHVVWRQNQTALPVIPSAISPVIDLSMTKFDR